MEQTKLDTFTVYFNNSEEFHLIKREIFVQKIYDFEFPILEEKSEPLIVDAGSHIGLTTLFFKKRYPQVKIFALEPQPDNFKLLEKNVWENQLENVTISQQALGVETKKITIHADTVWGWYSTTSIHQGAWTGNQDTHTLKVEAISLNDLVSELDQRIDLLKLDIQGAEQAILEAGQQSLDKINNLVIEFHPHKRQSLPKLVELLEEADFETTVWQKQKQVDPKKIRGLSIVVAQARNQK